MFYASAAARGESLVDAWLHKKEKCEDGGDGQRRNGASPTPTASTRTFATAKPAAPGRNCRSGRAARVVGLRDRLPLSFGVDLTADEHREPVNDQLVADRTASVKTPDAACGRASVRAEAR